MNTYQCTTCHNHFTTQHFGQVRCPHCHTTHQVLPPEPTFTPHQPTTTKANTTQPTGPGLASLALAIIPLLYAFIIAIRNIQLNQTNPADILIHNPLTLIFCVPGIALATIALYQQNRNHTIDKIAIALNTTQIILFLLP